MNRGEAWSDPDFRKITGYGVKNGLEGVGEQRAGNSQGGVAAAMKMKKAELRQWD